jgi:hypothetical protein
MTLVLINLVRIYRPIALWFLSIITVVMVTLEVIFTRLAPTADLPTDGLWTLVAGSAAKYWLLVVGLLLSAMNLRTFVTNGITRRDFTAGAALFGIAATVVLSLFVLLGHVVESAALSAVAGSADHVPLTAGAALGEFGRNIPGILAFGLSGWLSGAAYYRFNPLIGTALLVPAMVPAGLTTWTLGVGDVAPMSDAPLPYWPALAIVLAAVALGYLAVRRILGEAAIRRTAG